MYLKKYGIKLPNLEGVNRIPDSKISNDIK